MELRELLVLLLLSSSASCSVCCFGLSSAARRSLCSSLSAAKCPNGGMPHPAPYISRTQHDPLTSVRRRAKHPSSLRAPPDCRGESGCVSELHEKT